MQVVNNGGKQAAVCDACGLAGQSREGHLQLADRDPNDPVRRHMTLWRAHQSTALKNTRVMNCLHHVGLMPFGMMLTSCNAGSYLSLIRPSPLLPYVRFACANKNRFLPPAKSRN
jgi:hypothetical protein